jgi:TatD DNase family protein
MTRFYDAHNHLQDPWLAPHLVAILTAPPAAGMVVNGTEEADWSQVAALAAAHSWILPSYGVHPWNVDAVSPHWRERLTGFLDAGGFVGEIGLDRWKTKENFDHQVEMFLWQLAEASRRHLPSTIHCLRAWGALWELIRDTSVPPFLLHAYGGPAEMVADFVGRGGYFSFSGSFLATGRERKLEPFRLIPLERLLVETDAPAMAVPVELDRHPVPFSSCGQRVNHPGNLVVAYEGLARLRGMPIDELAGIVAANYSRLFGG